MAKRKSLSSELVFVYGTLMSGHGNHFHLTGARFLGNGQVNGLGLYDVTPYFPGAVRENGSSILGEIYQVDSVTLNSLDRLESNGFLYLREKLPVLLNGEVNVEAWVYLWLKKKKGYKVPLEQQPWRKVKYKCN